jgi:hypothetical protein
MAAGDEKSLKSPNSNIDFGAPPAALMPQHLTSRVPPCCLPPVESATFATSGLLSGREQDIADHHRGHANDTPGLGPEPDGRE